ncbi:MAG: hypothetical protein R8G01_21880 [Ilumatobacteraceae bacterium]|nr:hypothetical protein [Ilumatobacteraceae bacterium]
MIPSRETGRSTRRAVAAIALTTSVLAGCGASDDERVEPAAATTPAPSSTTAADTAPPTVTRVDEPATATTPADRLDEAVHLTWIGGSDLDLDGRSVPAAVMARSPMLGDRPLVVVADTKIAPLPGEVEARVEQAAERNTDGLVVILNPSWLSWDGHEECSGITPAHAYYACVLEPRPETDVSALRDDVRSLVDTIVATGIPAYLYVIPHSAESLADPELEPRLAATESQFAELDPELERIEYVGHILSRDLEPLREGVEFNDMVHPSEVGVEVLADFFAGEFVRFFGAHTPAD